MTDINIYDENQLAKLDEETLFAVKDKLLFRKNMAENVSITKLDYMLKVLRKVHGIGII